MSIVALARSGALDRAWRLFEEAGLTTIDNDPAVLSVLGRLLKDRALAAEGAEQRRLYLESAAAYARAGVISGEAYPLINAATLSLLAGRRRQSQMLARRVLDIPAGDEAETPYYRTATRAEALLLLGRFAPARKALAQAVSRAPRAYEDHASTLRQFGLILAALGESAGWLDGFRPPRCLHFAGHMQVAADDTGLRRRIRALLKEERVGFGYGALAAGADILIAEALLEAGAELHLVLPTHKIEFREHSVARFGKAWLARFDRIAAAAESVRSVGGGAYTLSLPAIRLAAEAAMGHAAMHAAALMTQAVQILVRDAQGMDGDWAAAAWRKSGRRQHMLRAARIGRTRREAMDAPSGRLAAMLRIDLGDIGALARLARGAASWPAQTIAPRWTGEALLVSFDTPADAARAALRAAKDLGDDAQPRIAGHYGIAGVARDPFAGSEFLTGPATALLGQIVHSTPHGAIHLSEDFAAALHACAPAGEFRTEYIGELPAADDPPRLFSLKR